MQPEERGKWAGEISQMTVSGLRAHMLQRKTGERRSGSSRAGREGGYRGRVSHSLSRTAQDSPSFKRVPSAAFWCLCLAPWADADGPTISPAFPQLQALWSHGREV